MEIILPFFLSFFLPSIWVFYLNKKDPHKEPFLWLFFTFFLGILSAFASFYSQKFLNTLIFDRFSFLFLFLSVIIEEFFKFLFVFIFIFPRKVFDEYIDAMIYMIFVAFGFAFIENVGVVAKFMWNNSDFNCFKEIGRYECNFLILFLRFLGPNLVHVLSSSLIGYGYALTIGIRNLLPLFLFFWIGVILHFLHNFFIINQSYNLINFLPLLWLVFWVVISEINYLRNRKDGPTK